MKFEIHIDESETISITLPELSLSEGLLIDYVFKLVNEYALDELELRQIND